MSQKSNGEQPEGGTTSIVTSWPPPNTDNVWYNPDWLKTKIPDEFAGTGSKLTTTMTRQVGGNHYLKYKIPIIDFIVQNKIPFREANIIKYVLRAPDKAGREDLLKAKHYLEMLINDYA